MSRDDWMAPDFKPTPYWWEAAPPEMAADTTLPEEVDVAIVGSGYCGLSAAIELAGAGRSVVVLEAAELGIGASTRSGGMVTGGQKFIVSGALQSLPAERRTRILEDAKASLEHIESLIERHALDADYRRCGRLITAYTPAHFARLEAWAELFNRFAPGTASLVPKAQLEAEIGGGFYHGGLLINNYGGLHPAKYHRALRAAARRHGAKLISNAEVRRIVRNPGGHVVETAQGPVAAKAVFVATNGYSGVAEPYLQSRVLPVASTIIATEPLPKELTAKLSPKGRMFSDTKRSLYYFRLSPDGTRVVFGGRASGRDLDERRIAPLMLRRLIEVWPRLQGYRVSHCWRGNVGMTADHVPHMGVHDGVHYAAGCNGSGVAMMTYLGHQTALKMLGRQNRPCAFDTDRFPTVPLSRARSWIVPAVTRYCLARDWLDRRLAR